MVLAAAAIDSLAVVPPIEELMLLLFFRSSAAYDCHVKENEMGRRWRRRRRRRRRRRITIWVVWLSSKRLSWASSITLVIACLSPDEPVGRVKIEKREGEGEGEGEDEKIREKGQKCETFGELISSLIGA
jgi:hypothetical protein